MQPSGKTWVACAVVLVHVVFGPALFAQGVNGPSAQIDDQTRARRAKYQELLQSVKPREGQEKDAREIAPSLLHRTREGYVAFLLMPRSSHIEVAKPTDWKPEDVADAFVTQWKGLLISDSASIQFKKTRLVQRQDYSVITYRQQYAGLEVHAADLIVQVNKGGGIDAVHSDVMRDVSAFESKQVSLEPTIDSAAARSRAIAWMNADWKTRYRKDIDLKLSTSPPKLMIFAPSVVGKKGASLLVWQLEIQSAVVPILEYVLLDARAGDVAHHYSLIDYALPPNATRYIYECNNTGLPLPSSPADPNGTAFRQQLFTYLGYSLEFFWEEHQRDGWDGSGSNPIRGYARYFDLYPPWGYDPFTKDYAWYHPPGYQDYEEGVYVGEWAIASDLVCHEYTHGVQGHMKTLDGSGESGALREVIADAWGEWIAQTYDKSNNTAWKLFENAPFCASSDPNIYMGQDVWRAMDDPSSVNTHWTYGNRTDPNQSDFGSLPQPDIYHGSGWYYDIQDDYGVHHNCGVGNKLTYLLTEGEDSFNGHSVSGFDISKAADLYYECLDLIPPACDYPGFYFGLIHAATNLSFNSTDRENIRKACEAVGICPPGELEAHWKLDETSGTTADDSAGSNDGSVSGATWTAGKLGNALSFDAPDANVALSSIEALQGKSASIAAWIKPGSTSGTRPIVTQYQYSGGYQGHYLCLEGAQPAFYLNDKGGACGSSITGGEWSHLVGTHDRVKLRIYVNGASSGDFNAVDEGGINHAAYIGYSGTGYYFNGLIDDVRVYNYALSDDEIDGLWSYGSPGCLAWWMRQGRW